MKNETWFERNSKLVAFLTGLLLILIAVWLYLYPPAKSGADVSGGGWVMPFVVILLVIGAGTMPSPLHELAKAYFRSRKPKEEKKAEVPQ